MCLRLCRAALYQRVSLGRAWERWRLCEHFGTLAVQHLMKWKVALLLVVAALAAGNVLYYLKAKRATRELAEVRALAEKVSQAADGSLRQAVNAARRAEDKSAAAQTAERQSSELVRFLALRYFDEWKGAKPGPSYQREVASVERTAGGWHIVIHTRSGNPRVDFEGMVRSWFHLYLKANGEFERIEKEPGDLVS
jgi:hypothetical protein